MEKYNLKALVQAVSSPMSEDQVWALCFKTTKEMRRFYNEIRKQPMGMGMGLAYPKPNLGSVFFSKEGEIFCLPAESENDVLHRMAKQESSTVAVMNTVEMLKMEGPVPQSPLPVPVAVDIEKIRDQMVYDIGQLLLEAMRLTGREEFSPTSTLQDLLLRMTGDATNRPFFKDILLAGRKEVKMNANIHYDLVVKDMIFQYVYGDKRHPKPGTADSPSTASVCDDTGRDVSASFEATGKMLADVQLGKESGRSIDSQTAVNVFQQPAPPGKNILAETKSTTLVPRLQDLPKAATDALKLTRTSATPTGKMVDEVFSASKLETEVLQSEDLNMSCDYGNHLDSGVFGAAPGTFGLVIRTSTKSVITSDYITAGPDVSMGWQTKLSVDKITNNPAAGDTVKDVTMVVQEKIKTSKECSVKESMKDQVQHILNTKTDMSGSPGSGGSVKEEETRQPCDFSERQRITETVQRRGKKADALELCHVLKPIVQSQERQGSSDLTSATQTAVKSSATPLVSQKQTSSIGKGIFGRAFSSAANYLNVYEWSKYLTRKGTESSKGEHVATESPSDANTVDTHLQIQNVPDANETL